MGGGGRTSGGSESKIIDKRSVDSMREFAERMRELGEEQWGIFKSVYLPYEKLMMQEGIQDLEANREIKAAMRREAVPTIERFYREASTPVNAQERQAEAEADVVGAYADVPEAVRRQMARTGTNLSGGRYESMMKAIALDRAKTISGARATARQEARDETFSKLKAAMAANSGAGSMLYNTAAAEGGYGVRSGADRAMGLYGNVLQAYGAGMGTTSKSRQSGWNFNFG